MYKNYLISLLVLTFSSTLLGQSTVTPVSTLKADNAEIIKNDDGTISIVATNLSPEVKVSQLLRSDKEAAEVYTQFPPNVVPLIEGKAILPALTNSYWIAVRNPGVEWIEVQPLSNPDPPDNPSDPDEPDDPTTPIDFKDLSDLANSLASDLNDPTTRSKLASALSEVTNSIAAQPTIGEAELLLTNTIENVLLRREGESRDKDWFNGWRKPLSELTAKYLNDGAISSPREVSEIAKAYALGLSKTTMISTLLDSFVEMRTADNCARCLSWKNAEKPKLVKAEWEVREINYSGTAPQFRVFSNGKYSSWYVGYMTIETFNSIVENLR